MRTDKFNSGGKIIRAESVTPSDTDDNKFDALYVGNTAGDIESVGNLKVQLIGSSSWVTFINVIAGSYFLGSVAKVASTGTTCTNIIGLEVER